MQSTAKQTTTSRQRDIGKEMTQDVSIVGVSIIVILSALIGLWAVTCLVSGISQSGVIGMVKGWFMAVMGG